MAAKIQSFESLLKSQLEGSGVELTGNALLAMHEQGIAQQLYGPAGGNLMPAGAQPFAKALGTSPGVWVNGTVGGSATGDVSPMALQNMDNVMTSILFTKQHLKFFRKLPRKASTNLVWEWTRRLGYGGGRRLPGFSEGGVPKGGTSRYERNSAQIRFHGELCGVTHPLMRATELGGFALDAVAEENKNGALRLMQQLETAIYFGDENILSASGQPVNYNGILKQVQASPYASQQIRDMQGMPILPEHLEDAARQLYEVAYVQDISSIETLASPSIITDFSKIRFGIDRRAVETGAINPTRTGIPFEGHQSNFGFIPMEPHIFLQRTIGDRPITSGQPGFVGADPNAPATPATVTAAAANNAASTLPGGVTQYYTVSSMSDDGESLPALAICNATPTAGQQITLTITNVSGATAYRVYRGKASDGSDAKWIADVPMVTGSTFTFVDTNAKMPGTGTMVMWMNDDETIALPQFLPLLRWPIAITTTTVQWFLLLYHTLVVKAPERIIIFTNVGSL
jgi:hypothetical protein